MLKVTAHTTFFQNVAPRKDIFIPSEFTTKLIMPDGQHVKPEFKLSSSSEYAQSYDILCNNKIVGYIELTFLEKGLLVNKLENYTQKDEPTSQENKIRHVGKAGLEFALRASLAYRKTGYLEIPTDGLYCVAFYHLFGFSVMDGYLLLTSKQPWHSRVSDEFVELYNKYVQHPTFDSTKEELKAKIMNTPAYKRYFSANDFESTMKNICLLPGINVTKQLLDSGKIVIEHEDQLISDELKQDKHNGTLRTAIKKYCKMYLPEKSIAAKKLEFEIKDDNECTRSQDYSFGTS